MSTKKMNRLITALFLISFIFGCGGGGAKTPPKDNKNLTDQKTLAVTSLKRRNYKQALEEIAAAEDIDPKDREVHLIRGIILFAIQDLEGAEKAYKTAIELDPGYSEAHFNICGLYYQQERYDEAAPHCQKAADDKLYKSRDRALTTIGAIHFNKGDLDMAKDFYDQSLKVNHALVYTHNQLGKLYVAEGRLAAAVDEFQLAVTGYPMYDEAHYNLAKIYLKLKETYKSCNSFRRVIEISPNSELGRKSKNYIKSVCSGVY